MIFGTGFDVFLLFFARLEKVWKFLNPNKILNELKRLGKQFASNLCLIWKLWSISMLEHQGNKIQIKSDKKIKKFRQIQQQKNSLMSHFAKVRLSLWVRESSYLNYSVKSNKDKQTLAKRDLKDFLCSGSVVELN